MGLFGKKPPRDPKAEGRAKESKRQKDRRKQIDKWERKQDKKGKK